MSVHALKPWTELVKLHPDVESGNLAEAVFAIDLGAVGASDPAAPLVYRDPDAFFAATYITSDLSRLLEEVLASLAGVGKYNRVLKLRSPFGGGKSHVLAALLHAARSRKSLNQIPQCRRLAEPGPVAVAVFDGEKFTATGDKEVGGGQKVHTMWGYLAWQLGPSAYQATARCHAARSLATKAGGGRFGRPSGRRGGRDNAAGHGIVVITYSCAVHQTHSGPHSVSITSTPPSGNPSPS